MRYLDLVSLYDRLGNTQKRLEKTALLAEFLKSVPQKENEDIILLLQGRIFPVWDSAKIGVSTKIVQKAIRLASGETLSDIEERWKDLGDLGDVAGHLAGKKKQATLWSDELTVGKVLANIRKLAKEQGRGSIDTKIKLIAELLASADERESIYIVRTILEDLRVGVAGGTLRDAIAWAYFGEEMGFSYDEGKIDVSDRAAYNGYIEAVERAYALSNDFGVVADAARKGRAALSAISITLGKPIKVMLAQKAKDAEEALATVGIPAMLEYKYDGFRMQIHKDGDDKIMIFTRRLEEVTGQFPEVVELVKKQVAGDRFILDCEAVGIDRVTGSYLPFQSISQRIRRKYDIARLAEEFPVELNIFDCIAWEGVDLLDEPFSKRRDILKKHVSEVRSRICLAKNTVAQSAEEVSLFYQESLDRGNEGIMVKKIDAPYKPGSRVGYMVKLKPVMETLELVIVGAEWGEGKRSSWLSSFSLACIDDEGLFLEIGKVGTGIKEKSELGVSFDELTELLRPLIVRESGRSVGIKPAVVVEVNYEEIQKSPTYGSGYALRFPRVVRIRDDRLPEDASSLEQIEDLYFNQKNASGRRTA